MPYQTNDTFQQFNYIILIVKILPQGYKLKGIHIKKFIQKINRILRKILKLLK